MIFFVYVSLNYIFFQATDADLNDTFTYSKDKFIANGTDLNNVPENSFNVSTGNYYLKSFLNVVY